MSDHLELGQVGQGSSLSRVNSRAEATENRAFESKQPEPGNAVARDWKQELPRLRGTSVTLRELSEADAPSLLAHLATPAVGWYIAPPPRTVDGFRTFVRWTRIQRRLGKHLCFGLEPKGQTAAVGVLQLWRIEPDFSTAEWGFALGERYWGTGLFAEAARLALDFAFDTLEIGRLEARAVEGNGRGNGILRKLGATPEGRLRGGFRTRNRIEHHIMWSILAEDRSTRPSAFGSGFPVHAPRVLFEHS